LKYVLSRFNHDFNGNERRGITGAFGYTGCDIKKIIESKDLFVSSKYCTTSSEMRKSLRIIKQWSSNNGTLLIEVLKFFYILIK
jgi:hypothetical protein